MSQWSKSSYVGPIENGWEEGKGRFTFPNGVVYEGQFNKGEFHGEGTLIYPNGVSIIIEYIDGLQRKNFKYTNCSQISYIELILT